jgi:hypothetical protein
VRLSGRTRAACAEYGNTTRVRGGGAAVLGVCSYGRISAEDSLDSMLSSCLLGCPKLCFQSSRSFCMYRIANFHRIFHDCICSYDGSMVENLRMQCTSKFDRISYLATIALAWNLVDILLYSILHLSELCVALTPEAPWTSKRYAPLRWARGLSLQRCIV